LIPSPRETASQFDKTVIPGEQNDFGRDPESRKLAENQIVLDPGSHPAPRDLTGMTNYDTVSDGGGLSLPRTRYGGGGGPLYFHPPLAPPIKGGGFKRMPVISSSIRGAFWHDFVKPLSIANRGNSYPNSLPNQHSSRMHRQTRYIRLRHSRDRP
jgi:hypothetical protein